jgi:hypothetical protein
LIDLGCGFAVAGSVAVMYDWGEQDQVWKTTDIHMVFSVLMLGQEVCLSIKGAAVLLKIVL